MKEEVIGEILETMDYERFKFSPQNRFVDRSHVNRLREQMKTRYVLAPINVTSDMMIQDGQHRFTAARELGKPIRYYIGPKLTPEQIASMNSATKKWTNDDYANTFAKQGNNNYRVYRSFRTSFPRILHCSTLILLTNEQFRGDKDETSFKSGDFVVQNETIARGIATTIKTMAEGGAGNICYKHGFILALLKVMKVKGFKMERLMSKLDRKGDDLAGISRSSDFIRAMEKIYNWKEPEERKLRLFEIPV